MYDHMAAWKVWCWRVGTLGVFLWAWAVWMHPSQVSVWWQEMLALLSVPPVLVVWFVARETRI